MEHRRSDPAQYREISHQDLLPECEIDSRQLGKKQYGHAFI